MSIYSSTVVLVGLCNNNPMLQTCLGTFKISIQASVPILMNMLTDGMEKVTVDFYHSDRHGDSYTFEKYCNGHGLTIRKDENGQWKFSTGLHGYDSGSSGILINGGPEMEQLYKLYLTENNKSV